MKILFVKVTDNCPGACSHCMYASTNRGGSRMGLPTFAATLDLARELGSDRIILSGGEPLKHPEFFKMLEMLHRETLGSDWQPHVLVETAGLEYLPLKRLVEFAYTYLGGRLSVKISVTPYHPMPNKQVEAYLGWLESMPEYPRRATYSSPAVDVRAPLVQVERSASPLVAAGRAVGMPDAVVTCPQPSPFVATDGNVYRCGCRRHAIGHVVLTSHHLICSNHNGEPGCAYLALKRGIL